MLGAKQPMDTGRPVIVSRLSFLSVSFAMACVIPTAFGQLPQQAAPQEPTTKQGELVAESRTGQPSAVQPKPANLITPELRGDIFMAKKMYREAVEAYKEGAHDSAVLLNKTGIAYHQMLQLDVAEKYYRLSVKANPHYAEAINNLGTIHFSRKNYRRAVSEYKKALRINPQSASIWGNLGSGYFERKDYQRAAESWQKALSLDPEVFENRSTQGVLIQQQTVEERAKYHMALARTYASAGMDEHALTYIRKALEEGFKEKKKLADDPAFAHLKELPEFKQLLALEPRVL
jgi:tetratricopeptide (TPR) repeat protein